MDSTNAMTANIHLHTYHALAHTLPDSAVFVFDPDWRCVMAGGPLLEADGIPSSELEGRPFDSINTESARRAVRPYIEAALAGEERHGEIKRTDQLPRELWYALTAAPVRDDAGDVVGALLLARDISESRQTERDLQRRQHLYRALFEQTNDAVFVLSLEGHHLEANQRALDMLGYTRAELMALRTDDIIPPDERAKRDTVQALLLTGETPPVYERVFMRKDGTRIVTEVSVSLVVDDVTGEPLHIQSVVRDITERKEMEDALRTSEERLWQTLSSITDYIYSYAVEPDGAITHRFVSPSLEKLLGYNVQRKVQDWNFWTSIIYPEDRETALAQGERLMQGADSAMEYRMIHADGRVIWVRDSARTETDADGAVHVYGVISDVTERKSMEDDIRLNEARLRLALEHYPGFVLIYDRDLRLRYVNAAAARFMGTTMDEVVGRRIEDMLPDSIARVNEPVLRRAIASRTSITEEVTVPVGGQEIPVSATYIPVLDENGEVEQLLAFAFNLLDQKRAEQRAVELAVQQEKVRVLSDFVSAISHDFHTPLSTINTSLYLLSRAETATNRQRHIDKLYDQVRHIETLVEGLTTMARLDRGMDFNFVSLDVNRLLGTVRTHVGQLAAEHKISLNFELADDLPRISGDWIALDRALVEVLRNGILYTPESGRVTVSTALEDAYIVVTVQDTGVGIPAAELSRIFDRLYRVEHHRPTGGQGLGLAIAERVVNAHGGHISVDSTVDKGSVFRLHLPLDHENQRRL